MHESRTEQLKENKKVEIKLEQDEQQGGEYRNNEVTRLRGLKSDSLRKLQENLNSIVFSKKPARKKKEKKKSLQLNKHHSFSIKMDNIQTDFSVIKQQIMKFQKQHQIQSRLKKIFPDNHNDQPKNLTTLPNIILPVIQPSYNQYQQSQQYSQYQPQYQQQYPYQYPPQYPYQYPPQYPPMYPPYSSTIPAGYNPYMQQYPQRPYSRVARSHHKHKRHNSTSQQPQRQFSMGHRVTSEVFQKQRKSSKKERAKKKVRLVGILKKIFRCVSYIFILKGLTKKIMKKRKDEFNQFWPNMFHKSINSMRVLITNYCNQFFIQMYKISNTTLQVFGNENQLMTNQKRKSINSLLNILLRGLQNLVGSNKFEQFCETLHIFCKHGANVGKGLLTCDELDLVCIQDSCQYLRMDRSMEKSQIITFVFMKIIIYNVLLQPWKHDEQKFNIKENKNAYNNFYYFSSILYQMMIHIQDKYLNSPHAKAIKLGNWKSLNSKNPIKCAPSLKHLDHPYREGQMISGLIGLNAVKVGFPLHMWRVPLISLETLIDKMYNKLRKIHAKFINEIYGYKNLKQFDK